MTPARRKLLELIKSGGPQTATELAQRLGVTPVAVRQHLQALSKDGLLVYVEERRPVGRPARRWGLSEAAQPFFPDTHREFAVGLIEAIDDTFGGEVLQRLVEERVRQQIRRYRRRMPDRGLSTGDVCPEDRRARPHRATGQRRVRIPGKRRVGSAQCGGVLGRHGSRVPGGTQQEQSRH